MSDTIKACLWMLGAVASFITMAIGGRVLAPTLDTFEIMTYRSLVGVVIVCGALSLTGTWAQVTRRHLGVHLLRNIGHFTGQNLWFAALALIPLAQVFALEFTTPLWVLVLAPLVLGERIDRVGALSAALGFVGILIVTRPGLIEVSPGVLMAAGCAVGFAVSILMTRRLTRTETTPCILFYLTTMQLVMGVVLMGWDGDVALPRLIDLPWVIVVGLAGLFAHYCYTTALSLAPATICAPVDFIRLPLIVIVGAVLFAEIVDPFVLMGAALILAANYLNIWYQSRGRAAPSGA